VTPPRGIPAAQDSLRPLRSRLALLFLAVACALAGCTKKPLTRPEIRAVTAEVVSAAERITARKSEITIRPEFETPSGGSPRRFAADDIYITLQDPAQASSLKQALAEIAGDHKLDVGETSADGVVRLDFSLDGNRTHTVHIVTPLTARARPPAEHGGALLAIIVDDLGHDRASADSVFTLQFPLTVAVLPHLQFSSQVAEEAFRRGDEVILHLPMESQSEDTGPEGARPEDIELKVGMSGGQVESALAGMLDTVPHASGVNNHQGSRATADAVLMDVLMPDLRARNLFFIDSRTTAATVAFDAAEHAGVPAASRKVFLDDVAERTAVLAQLDLAARDAARDGSAIAIGHPHPATIAALAEGVPKLEARGVRFVFVSQLVH